MQGYPITRFGDDLSALSAQFSLGAIALTLLGIGAAAIPPLAPASPLLFTLAAGTGTASALPASVAAGAYVYGGEFDEAAEEAVSILISVAAPIVFEDIMSGMLSFRSDFFADGLGISWLSKLPGEIAAAHEAGELFGSILGNAGAVSFGMAADSED